MVRNGAAAPVRSAGRDALGLGRAAVGAGPDDTDAPIRVLPAHAPDRGRFAPKAGHRAGGIRSRISSRGLYGIEIRGVFGKRLRDREQPGTRAQNSCARSCRERVIKIGKFGNRRRAVASRQSFKRFIKA